MKIIATVLYGVGTEEIIERAIASALSLVDHVLVIDTAPKPRPANTRLLKFDKDLVGYTHRKWPDSFSRARNFALALASSMTYVRQVPYDWAMTLDTDEAMQFNSVDVRAALFGYLREGIDLVYVNHVDGSYKKERFIRLPASGGWKGLTHEAYVSCPPRAATLKGVTFNELTKTPMQLAEKWARDLGLLTQQIGEEPNDPRWHYYMGETCFNLGQYEAASLAYDHCANLRGWDEESAWACYRSAEALVKLGLIDQAIDRCALGLARHAGITELAWLAGYLSFQAGRHDQAVYWSRIALVHGKYEGRGNEIKRIGFQHPAGQWEGPYDVLRWALTSPELREQKEQYEKLYEQAKAAREVIAQGEQPKATVT